MEGKSLTKSEISNCLEITDPFLFLDRVEDLIPGKSARGYFQLESQDWFFKCHLPREQAMPGTLLTEAMLQTLVLTLYTMEGHQGKLSFVTETRTKLFSKVLPTEELIIEANLLSYKRGIGKGEATITQTGKKVAWGEFSFASPHDLPRPSSPSR